MQLSGIFSDVLDDFHLKNFALKWIKALESNNLEKNRLLFTIVYYNFSIELFNGFYKIVGLTHCSSLKFHKWLHRCFLNLSYHYPGFWVYIHCRSIR
jgi:hypothetical protein